MVTGVVVRVSGWVMKKLITQNKKILSNTVLTRLQSQEDIWDRGVYVSEGVVVGGGLTT